MRTEMRRRGLFLSSNLDHPIIMRILIGLFIWSGILVLDKRQSRDAECAIVPSRSKCRPTL
jgi:hypothetical protein